MGEPAKPLEGAVAAVLLRVLDDLASTLASEPDVRSALAGLGVEGPAADPVVSFTVSRAGEVTALRQDLPTLLTQLQSSSPDLLALAEPVADLWHTASTLSADAPSIALPDLPDLPGAATILDVLLSLSLDATLQRLSPGGWAFARSLRLTGPGRPVVTVVTDVLHSPTAYLWNAFRDLRCHIDITVTGIITGTRATSVVTSPIDDAEPVDPLVTSRVPAAAQVLARVTLRLAADTYDDPLPLTFEILGTAGSPPGFAAVVVRVPPLVEPFPVGQAVSLNLAPLATELGIAVTGFGTVVPLADGQPGLTLSTSFSTGLSFGSPGGLRLELGGPVLDPHLATDGWGLRAGMESFTLSIPGDVAGPILALLLPRDGIQLRGRLVVAVDDSGVHLDGGVGLRTTSPDTIRLPGVVVRDLTSEITTAASGFGFGATGTVAVQLGPLSITVEGLGAALTVAIRGDGSGNLGVLDVSPPDLSMPTGLGVSIDAGLVKGGGFLRIADGEVSGALELSLVLGAAEIAVRAVGIFGSVDGQMSFVVVMSVSFSPAIELFLGLTLNAVGGIFGLNRTLDPDALTTLVRSGRMDDVMFPDDLAARALQVVDSVRQVFPPRANQVVVGPMLQLGWGRPVSFVTVSVGLVLTLPDPTIIALVGSLRISLPTKDAPLIDLRAGFSGSINLSTGDVRFDASLAGSRIAMFEVSGDLALRAGPQGFVFTAGGFHPKFTPPADLGQVRRLSISMSPSPILSIRAEAYVAVTASTVQFGGGLYLDADLGPIGAHGHLSLDVLIHFEPRFSFLAQISGQFSLTFDGDDVLSAQLDVLLEGPGSWHAVAHASIDILCFSVSGTLELSWGDSPPDGLGAPEDVGAKIRAALDQDQVWSHVIPAADNAIATVRPGADALHPLGKLRLTQTVAPVGIALQRLGASAVSDPGGVAVTIDAAGIGTPQSAQELFAPAQYFVLSDDEKLSKPAFVPYDAGYVLQGDTWSPLADPVTVDVVYEESLGDAPRPQPGSRFLRQLDATSLSWTVVGAAGRAHQSTTSVVPPVLPHGGLTVGEVRYGVADAATGALLGSLSTGSAELVTTSMRSTADRVVMADYELAGLHP